MKVDHISFKVGDNRILEDISFELKPGEIVGLIGPSAGGKSVLLKILCGVISQTSGTVQNTKKVSLCFQEGALFDSMSVYDNLRFPLDQEKLPEDEINKRVIEILKKVGLEHAINKFPGQLSGGMKRRISLARAMVTQPQVLLLDDPTAGLDPVASSVIMNLIKELHNQDRITLIVSHDLRRLIPIVDHLLGLFGGKIVFDDKVNSLKQAPEDLKSFVNCRYDINE